MGDREKRENGERHEETGVVLEEKGVQKKKSVHVLTCHGSRAHVSWFTCSRVMVHVLTSHGSHAHVSWFTCSCVMVHEFTCHGSQRQRLTRDT